MWTRPTDELHIWRVIELIDSNGNKRKFSIQEIPEDRYEEAVDFFVRIFLRDEIMCASLDVVNDPESVAAFRSMWDMTVHQGISVAAYEILEDNSRPILASCNMLAYVDDETDEAMKDLGTGTTKGDKVLKFIIEGETLGDPRPIHGVDGYLGACGLSTDPKYRRLGLGKQLLEIRDDIGKTYDIEYTSTTFTSAISQKMAEKVGFQTVVARPYDRAVESDGSLVFKKCRGKVMKIMEKKIKN